MNELSLHEQSTRIAGILPVLMRSLGSPDDRLSVSLPLAQLRLCRVLYDGPRPMSVLSRELGVSLSALTQMADRLERATLVARVASGSDRRVRHLQLTERGEGLMRFRDDVRAQRVLAVLQQLPPKTRSEIVASLETLLKTSAAVHGADAADKATAGAKSSTSE